MAVVQPAGDGFDAAGVREALRVELAGFKCPKRIIVVDELPRNTMGKVQKKRAAGGICGVVRERLDRDDLTCTNPARIERSRDTPREVSTSLDFARHERSV